MASFSDFLRNHDVAALHEEDTGAEETEEVETDGEEDTDDIHPAAAKLEKIAAKFFGKKFDDTDAKEAARNEMLKGFSEVLDELDED